MAHTLAAQDRPERAAEDLDPLAMELGEAGPVVPPPELVEALMFDLSPLRPLEWLQMDVAWWHQLAAVRRTFDEEVALRRHIRTADGAPSEA